MAKHRRPDAEDTSISVWGETVQPLAWVVDPSQFKPKEETHRYPCRSVANGDFSEEEIRAMEQLYGAPIKRPARSKTHAKLIAASKGKYRRGQGR
jgi:hypothetical protein